MLRILLVATVAALFAGSEIARAGSGSPLPQLCGYAYPSFTRFVVEDGGVDNGGHPVNLCAEYTRHGGPKILGLPVSRPFRVGSDLYQAFEFAMLRWRVEVGDTVMVNVLDLMHAAGRDHALLRMGIPPAQTASMELLTDPLLSEIWTNSVHPKYGLPTSPPTSMGPYVVQRFQRGLLRRWSEAPPTDLPGILVKSAEHGPPVERLMVGKLMRSTGMIPPRALIAGSAGDAQAYNWTAVPDVPDSFWSDTYGSIGGWDLLFHRAGAFDIGTIGSDDASMSSEMMHATSMGLSMAINGYVGRDSSVVQAGFDRNLALIDPYLWGRISSACGVAARDRSCTLAPDQLAELAARVRHHMDVTRRDDTVVAYWVLDDNPGYVRPAIELIHDLVQQENLIDQVARPTVCGFGGGLDEAGRPKVQSRAAFVASLANFTPTGCDVVALYPYASARAEAHNVEWSMADLLPYMLEQLRARGWDPARQPLIGIPQTFRFGHATAPSSDDVRTQTAAYCAGGASAILFYAWNDSATGPKDELFDAPDLRQGAMDGLAECRALWR